MGPDQTLLFSKGHAWQTRFITLRLNLVMMVDCFPPSFRINDFVGPLS